MGQKIQPEALSLELIGSIQFFYTNTYCVRDRYGPLRYFLQRWMFRLYSCITKPIMICSWGCMQWVEALFFLFFFFLLNILSWSPTFQRDTHVRGNKVRGIYRPASQLLTDIYLFPLKSSSYVDNPLNCQDGVSVSTLVKEKGCDFISTSRMHTKVVTKVGRTSWNNTELMYVNEPMGDNTITSTFSDICWLRSWLWTAC